MRFPELLVRMRVNSLDPQVMLTVIFQGIPSRVAAYRKSG